MKTTLTGVTRERSAKKSLTLICLILIPLCPVSKFLPESQIAPGITGHLWHRPPLSCVLTFSGERIPSFPVLSYALAKRRVVRQLYSIIFSS